MKKYIFSIIILFILYLAIDMKLHLSLNVSESISYNEFEPSGISRTISDDIVIVSDEGQIGFINSQTFSKKNMLDYRKEQDFEGVSSNGEDVFVAVEGDESIIRLGHSEYNQDDIYPINRYFHGHLVLDPSGDGFEGLAFKKETKDKIWFYVSNQSDDFSGSDRSAILLIEINKKTYSGKIIGYYPQDIPDISGLDFVNGTLYFISDTTDSLYITNSEIQPIARFHLPGKDQEGILIDNKHNLLYIADDSGKVYKHTLSAIIRK